MKTLTIALPLSLLIGFNVAQAATPFSVNAGDDGTAGWSAGHSGVNAGDFIGASGTIDTGGDSWGLFANSGDTANYTYAFDSALTVGQSVSIDVSIGNIDSGGVVGFSLQNGALDNRFEALYIGGDATDAWKLNDSEGLENITGPGTAFADTSYNSGGSVTFVFTLLAADTFSLTVDGVSVTNTALNLNASDISQIRLFNFNAGNSNDQFFNSLEVIPEPSSYALLLGIAALGWIVVRRR